MQYLKILNQAKQQFSISDQDLTNLLLAANQSTSEKDFDASKTLEKIRNFLGIFLLNPENILSQNQLVELIIQILQEQHFQQTAENFPQELTNFISGTALKTETINNYPKTIQEKFLVLYLGKLEKKNTFEELLENLSQINTPLPLANQILHLIQTKKFLPHHNILKNKAAFDRQYLYLQDDLNNIFDGVKQLAINFQNNTSTFVNFSRLRPKLAPIKSTQGVSSGPVSFIKIFTSTYEALRQNLQTDFNIPQQIILNIQHPDILEYLIFIKNFQKQNCNRNFNFLIELSPAFKEALQKEEDFELINPQNQQIVNYLSAKNTFDLIISTIEENPQIGLLNLPEHNQFNSADNLVTVSGIFNLAGYSKNFKLNSEALKKDLTNIQKYLKLQVYNLKQAHRLELNLTGLTDLLINLKISFSSVQSLDVIRDLILIIKHSLDQDVIINTNLGSPVLGLLEVSKGLETHENLITSKTSLSGQETFQIIPELLGLLQEMNLTSSELYRQILEQNSLQSIYQIPSEIKSLFLTSFELDSNFHLDLQKQFEQEFHQSFDKKIYLDNNLDQEKLKELVTNSLEQNLLQFRFCTFNNIISSENPLSVYNPKNQDKNFLLNLNQHRNRRSKQIQPPLFQIKKTEEVILPPIISPKN